MSTARQARARVPEGVTAGGQYATERAGESPVTLSADMVPPDDDGFERVRCTKCDQGASQYFSPTKRHSRCFSCGGTGYIYPRGPVQRAVSALGKARMAAARPRAHQVRPGDLISPLYRELGQAQWGVVRSVHLAQSREPGTRLTVIVFEDGSRLQTAATTVVARRSARLNLEPFRRLAAGEDVSPALLANPGPPAP